MVAVSATVLTGWAGQLSLGQFAFVAIGAYLTAYYGQEMGFLPVDVALGALWGVGDRDRDRHPRARASAASISAIITLGFALVVSGYLILQPRFNTSFTGFGRDACNLPTVGPWDFATDKQAYYYFCFIGAALIVILVVTHFRRTGIGRSLLAVRDNENNAAAYTVSPTRAKLIAFAISGGVAALRRRPVRGRATPRSSPTTSRPSESLRVLAVSVVGGLSSVTGAVLGTIVIVGIPTVFEGSQQLQLFASGVGMLILLLYCPGGLISIVDSGTRRAARVHRPAHRTGSRRVRTSDATRRAAVDAGSEATDGAEPPPAPLVTATCRSDSAAATPSTACRIEVRPGEVVGLIGTNGAGKTTLMNAISGFVKSSGDIEVFGRRVDRMAVVPARPPGHGPRVPERARASAGSPCARR